MFKKSIIDVKNYLRQRNLLKAGSDAPPDVLRSMYENAVLTGDVKNESKDTLLHNFYNLMLDHCHSKVLKLRQQHVYNHTNLLE